MIKLSSQDLEICYLISKVFDFGTDYKASLRHNHKLVQECKEILQDARHTEEFKGHYHEMLARIEGREREIALESVREKYIEIKNKILFIKADFSKKDLDSIFPTIAYYCMHTISRWIFYDDWSSFDKEAMKRDLESQWRLNYIFGLLYKHKVQYKYRMLCNAFSFSKDETIWSKDSPIPTMLHIPLLLVVIGVVGVSLFIDLRFGLIVLLCVVVAFVLTCIF